MRWCIAFILLSLVDSDSVQDGARDKRDDRPTCVTNTGDRGLCVMSSQCQRNSASRPFRSFCILQDSKVGICCPTYELVGISRRTNRPIAVSIGGNTFRGVTRRPFTEPFFSSSPRAGLETSSSASPLSPGAVRVFGERALAKIREMESLEEELLARGIVLEKGTTEELHQLSLYTDVTAMHLGKRALANDRATREIAKQLTVLTGRSVDDLTKIRVQDTNLNGSCQEIPNCQSRFYKYRTLDGSCNNLVHRKWGSAFSAFERLLPAKYADGVSTPRLDIHQRPLPSARVISSSLATDVHLPDMNHTLLLMQWGQFLDHDLQLTPIFKGKDNSGITCCHREILRNTALRHPECFEIRLSTNDSFYSQFQHSCMEFVRSLPAPRTECTLGPREQMNRVTSFLDGSTVYGSSDTEARSLRIQIKGKMRTSQCGGSDFLPFEEDGSCGGNVYKNFKAGDRRANQHLHLTALHTIWLREHNRIADELGKMNPSWNDEVVYQETRRIVTAQLQQITYNEFLPILLGVQLMQVNDLLPQEDGFNFNYDPQMNPTIINEFSTAAFRFGHSLVQGILRFSGGAHSDDQVLPFRDQFLNSYPLHQNGFLDKTLKSLLTQTSQKMDVHFSNELTRHLFERRNSFGLDLVALDIQRGRDHGIPGYNHFRKQCGLQRAVTFDDLHSEIASDVVRIFKQHYRHVDDVDLFVAGVAEKPLPGAILGPTFACIIAEQFIRLKRGDRFWYENGLQVSSFSEAQIAQIRKVSLARVMCDTSDDIRSIQPQVFYKEDLWNPRIPCDSKQIPRMNLKAWKNEPVLL